MSVWCDSPMPRMKPAAGDRLRGERLLRHHDRVARVRRHHRGAELDARAPRARPPRARSSRPCPSSAAARTTRIPRRGVARGGDDLVDGTARASPRYRPMRIVVLRVCRALGSRPSSGRQDRSHVVFEEVDDRVENASFWSPATMCGAPPTSTSFAPGIWSRNSCDALVGDDVAELPAHEQRRHPDVAQRHLEQRLEVRRRAPRCGSLPMNFGSQCQYQRPSGFWRSTFISPAGLTRLGRFGVYAAMASAASSSVAKPLEARAHEVLDAVDALRVRPVRDVDDDEPARHHAVGAFPRR